MAAGARPSDHWVSDLKFARGRKEAQGAANRERFHS